MNFLLPTYWQLVRVGGSDRGSDRPGVVG